MSPEASPSSVPQFAADRDPESFLAAGAAKLGEVLRSGRFILGPEVEAFEKETAAWTGVKHALAVSSGTDALLLALMGLGIGPDDEVICPTYTFFATAGSVSRVGATPVFADSDPTSYNITAGECERLITPKTKAIMPVHLFGQAVDMDPILELGSRHNLAVIEDAAQAIGAQDKGRRAGAIGTVGCFSFYPTKTLGGFGEGGLVTTNDDDLARKMRMLRNHGCSETYKHELIGGNFRMDAFQGALLRLRLPELDGYIARRQAIASFYREKLTASGIASDSSSTPVTLPAACQPFHTWNQFVIRVRDGRRDALRAHLAEKKVGSAVYYPCPLHLQPCFQPLASRTGSLPIAELLAKETLALPMFPQLTEAEATMVVETISGFFKKEA